MSSKPLGLHCEAFSQEKWGGGREKASFYLDTSDWHFLIISLHTTWIIMSYI